MPEVHAVEEALAHLGEVAGKLLVAYRSLQDSAFGGDLDRIDPIELQQTIADLLAGATRSVLMVAGRPDRLGLLPSSAILAKAAAGGAAIRVLGSDDLRADNVAGPSLRALVRSGVQVATAPAVPPAMLLVDDRVALMTPATSSVKDDGCAFRIRDPAVAGYLASAIDCLWVMALPFHDLSEAIDGGLSPIDQALLRLLAQGKKQHEVARSLHLSVRTVSRRIADLKQELKADSPLQAGMEAVRRGWL